MRIPYTFFLFLFLLQVSAQVPVTQIEGRLELYDRQNFNSIYLGRFAGFQSNSNAMNNTIIGGNAGNDNISGSHNTFLGKSAGFFTSTGSKNVFLGSRTGFSIVKGEKNIVIGYEAGPLSIETSNGFFSNRLFIDNQQSDKPLIYGEFDNNRVFIHGDLRVNRPDGINVLDVDENTGNVVLNFGQLGIGIQPGTFKLHVNGTAAKPGGGNWSDNSDARLKKDIASLNSHDILSKVLKMQGVTYLWDDDKTGMNRPKGTQIGFIAQDLKKVWPDKVFTDNLGFLMTAYGDFDPMFVEAIKALAAKNKELEKENQAIKERLAVIEALLSEISDQ